MGRNERLIMLDDGSSRDSFEKYEWIVDFYIQNMLISVDELVYAYVNDKLKDYFSIDPNTGDSLIPENSQGYMKIPKVIFNDMKNNFLFETNEDKKLVFLTYYEYYMRQIILYRDSQFNKIIPTWENIIIRGFHCDADYKKFDALQNEKYKKLDDELWGIYL